MRISHNAIYRALGWSPTGDLGPWTFYTSKDNGIVFFPKAPPKLPPTRKQLYRRARFAFAAQQWRALPRATKAKWRLAARRANLRITGYNLFTYYVLTQDQAAIDTVARIAHLDLEAR